MPTEREYTGNGIARSEVTEIHIERVIPGATYGLRVWNNRKISTTGGSSDTATDIANRLGIDLRLAGLDATDVTDPETPPPLRLYSTPGETSGLRIDSSPGCYLESVVAGREPVAQQVRVTLPVGTTGGTWSLTFNWGGSDETLSSIAGLAVAASLASGIDGLATPANGDASVILEHPGNTTTGRSYLITVGGTLAGLTWTVTGSGAGLTGTAEIEIATVQSAAGSSVEIQALWFAAEATTPWDHRLRISRGGVTSNWVENLSSAGTGSTSFNAALQAACDQVCGAGAVLPTSTVILHGSNGVLILKWVNPGAQGQVTIEAQAKSPSADASGWYAKTTLSQTLREAGANQNEFLVVSSRLVTNSGLSFNGTTPFPASAGTVANLYSLAQLTTAWSSFTGGATPRLGLASSVIHGESYIAGTNTIPNAGLGYVLEFTGSNANTNMGAVTASIPGGIVKIIDGEPLVNQIDQMIVRADGGTFTASSDGTNYSSALAYGLSAGTLQTGLRALTAIGAGNCNVTGAGTPASPYLIEYVGAKAQMSMPLLRFTLGSLLGGFDPTQSTRITAVPGRQQVDQLFIDPNANGGFLMFRSGGDFSLNVAYNTDAATLKTALDAIDNVLAWGLTITGAVGSPFLLTWTKFGLAPVLLLNQDNLTVSVSSLLRLQRLISATGPNFWNEPENWSGNTVPSTGDTPIFRQLSADINEGLRQRSVWTRFGDRLLLEGGDFVAGQAVKLKVSSGGTLPTATISGATHTLSTVTEYVIVGFDAVAQTGQLAMSLGAAPVVLTGAGTGTFTLEVVLLDFQHSQTYTGKLGRSARVNGRTEERPRALLIGSSSLQIGLGSGGSGSELWNLDLGTTPCAIKQANSGTARLEGEFATNIRASHTATTVELLGGSLALSPTDLNAETSIVGDVKVRNATIGLGNVSLGSYDGQGDQLEAFEATFRGAFSRRR